MSQENQSEEIDLMQLFGMIKEFFRKFLKLIVSVVSFYKKKFILFLILGLIGLGLGFFMDQYQDKKDNYAQEVIIEPKYDSVEYIYDFVEDLEDNFKDDRFVKSLGLDMAQVENVKKIILEPVIKPEDVLRELQSRYGDKESFIETYNEKLLKEKKYRNFYKKHKLTMYFKNRSDDNLKITNTILEYFKSNDYYKELVSLRLKQIKTSVDQNKKSLRFINEYLDNLSKNPAQEDDKFVFATESETPTISSLLKRKEVLMQTINRDERLLVFDKEVFGIVSYSGIVSKRKILLRRMIFMLPLMLVGLVSTFYFFGYLSKSINEFVDEE